MHLFVQMGKCPVFGGKIEISWNSGFLTKFTCKRLSSDPKSQLFLDSSRKPHWYCHGLTLTKDWAIPVHSYPENQRSERHVQLTLETKYHLQMMPFQSEFGFWSMIGLAFVSSPTSIRQILFSEKNRKKIVLIFSKIMSKHNLRSSRFFCHSFNSISM